MMLPILISVSVAAGYRIFFWANALLPVGSEQDYGGRKTPPIVARRGHFVFSLMKSMNVSVCI